MQKGDPIDLYEQVAAEIRRAIAEGECHARGVSTQLRPEEDDQTPGDATGGAYGEPGEH